MTNDTELLTAVDRYRIVTEVQETVRLFRAYMAHNSPWVTPRPLACLQFAVEEAAEVLGAELRQDPQYARNNERGANVQAELADTLIMCLSTFGDESPKHFRGTVQSHQVSTAFLIAELASALHQWEHYGSEGAAKERVSTVMHFVVHRLGHAAVAQVAQNLLAIYEKHATRKPKKAPAIIAQLRKKAVVAADFSGEDAAVVEAAVVDGEGSE